MSTDLIQNRFTFPEPTGKHRRVMDQILELMQDGRRRSKKEIRDALGLDPDTEVTARLRDLRKPEYGSWPISDSRADGPDADGIHRYELKQPKPNGGE